MAASSSTPMSSSPHTQYDLTSEENDALQANQLVLPQVAGGKRKISASFLIPSTSPPEYGSSSSFSVSSYSASIRYRKYTTPQSSTFDLPEHLVSIEAIEFCGFVPEMARELYTRFVGRSDKVNNPDTLDEYMRAQILMADSKDERPPAQSLARMGLTDATKNAIMHPRHSEIRKTQTIRYWAMETVHINWLTLLDLKAKLKVAAKNTRAKKKAKTHAAAVFAPTYTATIQSTLENLSLERNIPRAHISLVTESPPLHEEDHYVLYKAKVAVEMEDWIDIDNGQVNIHGLRTYPGGDFNHRSNAYYWTLEKATAEQYHHYASERCKWSDIWMIRVEVKKSFINSLRSKELWFSRDWKEYVWYCRKGKTPPAKYHDFCGHGGADIIKGHVCGTHSGTITNIKQESVQERISEDDTMKNPDGHKSSQWALMQEDSANRFAQEIKGKIHIEITPPVISPAVESSSK